MLFIQNAPANDFQVLKIWPGFLFMLIQISLPYPDGFEGLNGYHYLKIGDKVLNICKL